MANAIITFEVMPESPETDMEAVKAQAVKTAQDYGAKGNLESSVEPLAFGLKKVVIMGMYEMDDDKDFDEIPQAMKKIEGVQDAKIEKMDLAMG